MSFIKSLFKSVAISAAVSGLIKGADALTENFGAIAKMTIISGKVEITKGTFNPRAKTEVQSIITERRIQSGWIERRNNGRLVFSDEIPASLHQRLLNVIGNA